MLTTAIRQRIEQFIHEVNSDIFVVEMLLKAGRTQRLILRIDTDKGISMSECGAINRKLGLWLDEEDVFDFEYAMEVSSPGVGESIKLTRQYHKNIGRNLRVVLKLGGEIMGQLTAVAEDSLQITPYLKKNYKKGQKPKLAEESKTVAFEDIQDSKVVI